MSTPLRVLLIQDSETDAAIVLGILRRGGYEPSWSRVDSASGLVAAMAEPWEVVLCSWYLPGLDGAQALAMVRARAPEVPVVVLASDPGRDEAVDAIKAGADDVVSMQTRMRLPAVIDRALREAEIRRARRRAEAALRESGERFVQAFAHAPIGMALVGIDGITLQVNRAFCDMLGVSEAEMVGMPVWRLTHPDDMPPTLEQLQRLVEGERDAWYMEKRYFHRDGHVVWARSNTWLVRAADGRALYVVSQLQDITERKRLEEQTQRLQADLAHALRIATMGEMVAQIAHEINQPLASIANFANGLVTRLERGLDDVEAMRHAAAHIADEALRASDVIRRLRDFLRKGEARRERCDVNDVVRDAIRLTEPELRQHAIHLSPRLAAEKLDVEVDRVQVAQVVLNLMRNAVEALVAGDGDQRELCVQTAAGAHDTVVVSLRDSGVGLPLARESRIFDAFFTTKEHGLGLGLSISRSIVEAHGGTLWAQSNSDQGATVAFALPVAPRPIEGRTSAHQRRSR